MFSLALVSFSFVDNPNDACISVFPLCCRLVIISMSMSNTSVTAGTKGDRSNGSVTTCCKRNQMIRCSWTQRENKYRRLKKHPLHRILLLPNKSRSQKLTWENNYHCKPDNWIPTSDILLNALCIIFCATTLFINFWTINCVPLPQIEVLSRP